MNYIVLVLMQLLALATATAAEIEIEANNPRPFGYVVGDTLSQEILLRVRPGLSLDTKKLPKPGRLSAWIELRNVDVIESTSTLHNTYRVKFDYQLPNSPGEIRVIELPAQHFVFLDGNKTIEEKSVEWPITISPITPAEVLARDGLEAMRPNVAPQGIDIKPVQKRICFYSLALIALLAYWAHRYFGIPFLTKRRRPFTRTYPHLNRLAKTAAPNGYSSAIEQLHQALNETAGKSLFADNVEPFLTSRNVPAKLADMTTQFFHLSREEFFGAGVPESQRSFTWVLEFCRAWRDIERGIV